MNISPGAYDPGTLWLLVIIIRALELPWSWEGGWYYLARKLPRPSAAEPSRAAEPTLGVINYVTKRE